MSKKKTAPDDSGLDIVEVNGVKGVRRGNLVSATISADKLVIVSWNANEMKPEEYELLKETIVRDGFLDPLSVIPAANGYFTVNGGEHRLRAARDVSLNGIPCDIMYDDKWLDEDLQKLQSVRFNVIRGQMNPDKFLTLYNRVAEKYGKEAVTKLMGYTSEDGIKSIIKKVSKELKATLSPEMAKEFEKKAKDVKTVNDLERIINHIFNEHGDTLGYNFIVFSYGGKSHTYISATKDMYKALEKIMKRAKETKTDINELLTNTFVNIASQLDEEIEF